MHEHKIISFLILESISLVVGFRVFNKLSILEVIRISISMGLGVGAIQLIFGN